MERGGFRWDGIPLPDPSPRKTAGAGRHKGRLGALEVELANGVRIDVGTGFSDAEREDPPPVGSIITFRYQELSDAGVPRFPSFVGLHDDVEPTTPPEPVIPASSPGSPAAQGTTKKAAKDPAPGSHGGQRRAPL